MTKKGVFVGIGYSSDRIFELNVDEKISTIYIHMLF